VEGFAQISNGRERWASGAHIPRHRHDRAYAAVVLCGAYEESGSRGRFCVCAGDVLLHDAFDAHLNHFARGGAQIVNLLLEGVPPSFGLGRVFDPDAIARLAERDVLEARAELAAQLRHDPRPGCDWQDKLAADLLSDSDCRLHRWAREHDLATSTVSRGFRKVFGVAPAVFRWEARARRAFSSIVGSDAPLTMIALATGFADQSHMCRAIRTLTGAAPGHWRRSNRFKTGAREAF
jgi:AraC-like DNA-binding protein